MRTIQSIERPFANIRHLDEKGNEYWRARELYTKLDYKRWDQFEAAIQRAKDSCSSAGQDPQNHFYLDVKMVALGSGAQREIPDYMLTRHACYLIAMNGDPKKRTIAHAQQYFSVQVQKAEANAEIAALVQTIRNTSHALELLSQQQSEIALTQHRQSEDINTIKKQQEMIEQTLGAVKIQLSELKIDMATKIPTAEEVSHAMLRATSEKIKSPKNFT